MTRERHDCDGHLARVQNHPANESLHGPYDSYEGYRVYRCRVCGDYWGCHHQYDPAVGNADDWHRFGPETNDVRRHH